MQYNQAFADMFKNTMDFNQIISTGRRNMEALTAANQVVVDSAQTIARRQAEVARANIDNAIKVSKDMMSSGTPETSISKQSDLMKAFFENTLTNLREVSELVTKSSFEAFDVLNRRTAESLEEISTASTAASSSKKKSA
ncbi:MAG: phasin family protein [Rickettsiales bacterium]|jgi:phasin family protein